MSQKEEISEVYLFGKERMADVVALIKQYVNHELTPVSKNKISVYFSR